MSVAAIAFQDGMIDIIGRIGFVALPSQMSA
jgi:hypothetical protein